MSKAELRVELSTTGNAVIGGGMIPGVVHVHAEETFQCSALTVAHRWQTHGRGNTANGGTAPLTLFSGQFTSGEKKSFPFEIPLVAWPPTYHGQNLNIDHTIEARLDLPWAFDITAAEPVRIVGGQSPEASSGATADAKTKMVVAAVAALIIGIFPFVMLVAFFAFPFAIVFLLLIAGLVGALIAANKLLPRWKLGKVEVQIPNAPLSAGGTLTGTLQVAPRKPLQIGGVQCILTCEEVCVSGSGSNRSTHSHGVYKSEQTLLPAGLVPSGIRRLDFSIPIPEDAIPTIKLPSNEVLWYLWLRVDIPRWPDFKTMREITVHPLSMATVLPSTPTAESSSARKPTTATFPPVFPSRVSLNPAAGTTELPREAVTMIPEEEPSGSISFAETAKFILAAEGDHEQIDTLVSAVVGFDFQVSIFIERTVMYAGPSDSQHAYPQGRIAFGQDTDSELLVTLYLSPQAVQQMDDEGEKVWNGRATIVGYDFQQQRLQIRAIAN